MYSQFRKDNTNDAKKLVTSNVSIPTISKQKPSPTSGDDVTKGESTLTHTQNISEHTGFNSSRFTRKKSGLKPIRPTGLSSSNLYPTTPGKFAHTPGKFTHTPGKLSYTPRLNFKENDQSKFNSNSEFPSTPKLCRSESTPELHRVRKMDHLLLSTEKSTTLLKSHSILQESNVPNLLTMTSDSLPDIFRKPITQPSDIIFNSSSKGNEEEKVSKWGYGPSSMGDCPLLGPSKPTSECTKDITLKLQAETTFETPKIPSKFANPPTVSSKICQPLLNQFEKSTAVESFQPNSTLELLQNSTKTFEKLSNVSATSNINTASNLYSTTQPTIKCLAKDKELDKTSELLGGASSTNRPAPPIYSRSIQSNPQPTAIALSTNILPSSNKLQPQQSAVTDVKAKISEEQEVVKMPPPPVDDRPLQRPPPKHKQISVNGKVYTVMKLLGRGGSSVVYQVLNSTMTDIFALKVVRLESVDEVTAEGYINEVRLLKQLQGLSRVVRLLEYEYNEEEEKLLLIMEKGDTDFASVIRSRSSVNAVNPTLVRFYWQEMLESVGQIHEKNVIHSDLKPANFLLVSGGLKLIDFGIATSIQGDMTSIMKDSQCGTYNYMAPEAIKSSSPVGANQEYKISRKTDVWSLGCILYNLIYKNPPFHKIRDTIEKLNAIVDERYVIEFPATADPLAIAVLKSCLDRNPRNRPSIEQLLCHPYLTYHNDCTQLQNQLEPFMLNGKLTDEAKELIRQWL